MDQIERIAASLLAALNKINTSIQKSKTYKDGNLITLGSLSAIQTIAVSGVLGGVAVETELIGSSTPASGVANAAVNVLTELLGPIGITGNVAGIVDTMQQFISNTTAITGVSGLLEGTTRLMASISNGATITAAEFQIETELIGACDGTSSGAAAYMWT